MTTGFRVGFGKVTAAVALSAAAWLCFAPLSASVAQTVSNNFGGFSRNSNAPIDIESDTLEVQDAKKLAIFKGNVKAVQAGMTLRSKELHVKYAGEPGSTGGGSSITTIDAKGKVVITTEDDQTATSNWARFDVKSQTVTIWGDVVLSQGENVIKGDRLVIDLKTNRSRFENQGDVATGKRPRVRMLVIPNKGETGNPTNKKQGN
jgi:lipopolysaccharide export system protein LptA